MHASQRLAKAIQELDKKGFITSLPICVGKADRTIREHANSIGTPLVNDKMYFRGNAIRHAIRSSKEEAGICVSDEDFIAFPTAKSRMEIYYDKSTRNYTYTDKLNKFVVKPNQRIKIATSREKVVSLVTASRLRENGYTEFKMGKYIRIK